MIDNPNIDKQPLSLKDQEAYGLAFERMARGKSSLVEEDLLFRKFTLTEIKDFLAGYGGAKPRRRVKRRLDSVRHKGAKKQVAPQAFYKSLSGIGILFAAMYMVFYVNKPSVREVLAPHSLLRVQKDKAPSLSLFKDHKDDSILLFDGARVAKNDRLRIKYQRAGYTHGVIFSVGGQRQVTLHHPKTLLGSTRLSSEALAELEDRYTLGDSPDFERFFFIAKKSSFKVKDVWWAITKATSGQVTELEAKIPGLEKHYAQSSIALIKEAL